MSDQLGLHYLKNALERFRAMKELAERAIAQTNDEELFRAIDPESNSIAVIIKHMSGNMLSRWTDFLTTDGEKPGRNRETEFVAEEKNRAASLASWEEGWACLFAAIEPLAPEDLLRHVTIRAEQHTVVEAINRQLTHYSYHIGQIVFLAKHLKSDAWQTLSIARGNSNTFNQEMQRKHSEAQPLKYSHGK